MQKLRNEYLEHLEAIALAQQEFEENQNVNTATKLSNLKYNEFQNYLEVFTPEYIKEQSKDLEGELEYTIIYGTGLYNHIAESLRVREL